MKLKSAKVKIYSAGYCANRKGFRLKGFSGKKDVGKNIRFEKTFLNYFLQDKLAGCGVL